MKSLACIYVCAPHMCPVPVELELQTSMWVLGTEPGPPQEHPVLLRLHHLSSPRNVFRKCCFYQEVSSDPLPVSLYQTLLLLLPHHHPGCATHPKFTAPQDRGQGNGTGSQPRRYHQGRSQEPQGRDPILHTQATLSTPGILHASGSLPGI